MAKLKEVCTFYSGTGFPTKYQGNDEGEYAFYKVGDIANNVQLGNKYLSVCNNYISGEVAKEIKGCILPKDTVVFAKIGEAVKLNRRAITSADCLIDNNAMGLAPIQDKLRLDYLFYYMRNLKMEKLAESTTVPSVRKSLLEELEIKVPSLEEQKEIGEILDKVSVVIQTRKQEIEQLDLLIKARFVEMFGDPVNNEKGWELKTFNELSYMITDGEHTTPRRTSEGIYLLSARNILNHSLQLEDVDYIDQEEYDRIAKRVIPQEGDILISCSGTVGHCCSVPANLKFQMVRSAAIIRFKEEINPIFAEYMITSNYLQEQINRSKTASSQANLFQGKIKELKGFVPPIELQKEFLLFVKQVNKSKFEVRMIIIGHR